MSDFQKDPPLERMQENIIGLLGVAVELIKENPSLNLTEEEKEKLADIETSAKWCRKGWIEFKSENVSKAASIGVSEKDHTDETLIAEILSDMHKRVTTPSVFDMKRDLDG